MELNKSITESLGYVGAYNSAAYQEVKSKEELGISLVAIERSLIRVIEILGEVGAVGYDEYFSSWRKRFHFKRSNGDFELLQISFLHKALLQEMEGSGVGNPLWDFEKEVDSAIFDAVQSVYGVVECPVCRSEKCFYNKGCADPPPKKNK